jgi:hypothetical protein
VRLVRNTFAHQLELDSLSDIDMKVRAKLRALYMERKIRTDAGPDDLHNVFQWIAYMATTGLYSYHVCVRSLSAAIRDPRFERSLREASDKVIAEIAKTVRKHAAQDPANTPKAT